jgi:hypothetical protein
MLSTPPPPAIGDALFARSIPAHRCVAIPRTRDELTVDGAKAHYTPLGVFYVKGRRVVAIYAPSVRQLCNASARTITAEWTR